VNAHAAAVFALIRPPAAMHPATAGSTVTSRLNVYFILQIHALKNVLYALPARNAAQLHASLQNSVKGLAFLMTGMKA